MAMGRSVAGFVGLSIPRAVSHSWFTMLRLEPVAFASYTIPTSTQ